ncbi:AcrR family transcriptional regulator [Mycobacterium sp. OAS707]|uniref:TetR/AcrR family transcriptional regulator n=1 Tax=unclassified Mycobacterium TaxID=2642494 RepID=UPI00178BDB67|nr:AcrR family transcriptional regulator [Mycobacterium sp. OAS707]
MADTESRQRLVAGAADMMRRRGLNATSVRELAKHAQAPLGSTYHYFPGGKYELAAEAVRWADDLTTRALVKELQAGPLAGLRAFLKMWRKIVVDSDFRAGCPVLAASVEDLPDDGTAPRDAAAVAFGNWTSLLAQSLRDHGASDAESLAVLIVAAVEGSVAMCRAQRSTESLDQIAAQLESLVAAVTDR